MCYDCYQKLEILSEQMGESRSDEDLSELDNTDIQVYEKEIEKDRINQGLMQLGCPQ